MINNMVEKMFDYLKIQKSEKTNIAKEKRYLLFFSYKLVFNISENSNKER